MSTSTASRQHASLDSATLAPAQPSWKTELNAKLEAHRQRRIASPDIPAGHQPAPPRREPEGSSPAARATAARVAARVAERYANAPSYSEMLSANAAAASAAAEAAALAVHQAHNAAQVLLSSLANHQACPQHEFATEQGFKPEHELDRHPAEAACKPHPDDLSGTAVRTCHGAASQAFETFTPATRHAFEPTIEHHEPLPSRSPLPPRDPAPSNFAGIVDPFAEATVPAATSLAAKLIEFPRELVAPRKARPRFAEGPLAEPLLLESGIGDAPLFEGLPAALPGAESALAPASLRIFEVPCITDQESARLDHESSGAEQEFWAVDRESARATLNLPGPSEAGPSNVADSPGLAESGASCNTASWNTASENASSHSCRTEPSYTEPLDAWAGSQSARDSQAARQPECPAPAVYHREQREQPRHLHSESHPGSFIDESQAPDWQSIRLGAHPDPHPDASEDPHASSPGHDQQTIVAIHAASIADRAMAALVDLSITGIAFLVFVLVFAACTTHPPVTKAALTAAAVIFAAIALFYQWLFMSYGGGTPGMRYARISLCTFDDDNPSRKALRSRVTASLLSLLPLGLGFLWALFDEDSLGWHDRMTRTYQRSYR